MADMKRVTGSTAVGCDVGSVSVCVWAACQCVFGRVPVCAWAAGQCVWVSVVVTVGCRWYGSASEAKDGMKTQKGFLYMKVQVLAPPATPYRLHPVLLPIVCTLCYSLLVAPPATVHRLHPLLLPIACTIWYTSMAHSINSAGSTHTWCRCDVVCDSAHVSVYMSVFMSVSM